VAARLLAAIDEEVVFTTSLPIEGAPNPIESKLLEDVAARRDALARLLETMPAGEAPER
jgi:hypothetical protein